MGKGEDINNCPQDCNEYSLPPPDGLNIADTGQYTIGTYIYPGWNTNYRTIEEHWAPIMNATPSIAGADQPKVPIQNYYQDSNPVAADRMLQWGLERGVSLYVFDWYWLSTGKTLNDTLESAFLKSKYLMLYPNDVQFAIMWANHYNYSGAGAKQNIIDAMDYCIQNYFPLLQYWKIGNKPVFLFWDYSTFTDAIGRTETMDVFSTWNIHAAGAGFGGVYLASVFNHDASLGIDGRTAYNYINYCQFDPTRTPDGHYWATYDNMVTTFQNKWTDDYSANNQYFPIISPGWDNTPWANRDGYSGTLVINSSPDKYKTMCQNAKSFVDSHPLLPTKAIINEAWDEWGEGAVLAPTQKWQFGYLDAIKSVFVIKTSWEFNTDGDMEGWIGSPDIGSISVAGGCLRGATTGIDPCVQSPDNLGINASKRDTLEVRSNVSAGAKCQFFFTTESDPTFTEAKSVIRDIVPNTFNKYRFDFSSVSGWSGKIKQLRFDMTDTSGAYVAIDYIRVVKCSVPALNNPPETPVLPSGPASGAGGVYYQYTTAATDPDGGKLKYGWDWDGDGTVDEWSGWLDSGVSDVNVHQWPSSGIYNVKVRVIDQYGAGSGWSGSLQVTITGSSVPEPMSSLIIPATAVAATFIITGRRRKKRN